MKKQAFGIIAALFALTLALVAGAYATDTETAELSAADVYAILYEDGELVFQYGDATEPNRAVTKTYPVDLSAVYTVSYGRSPTPWCKESEERESIRVVSFMDKVSPISTAYWFTSCYHLERVDNIQNLDTANVTNMASMFAFCSELTALDVSHFDTANVKNMGGIFVGCSGLTTLDVSHFNTANATNMNAMFSSCSGLTTLNLSSFDTAKVTNMVSMFEGCSNLMALDLSSFDTSHVTDMQHMFHGCNNLTALDISHFNTSNVKDMQYMFHSCLNLTALDLSHFDTSNVKNMMWMFYYCSGLTELDVSHFNTANVTVMWDMFCYCSDLTVLDLSSFDTANATDIMGMTGMFEGCSNLKTILVSDKFTTDSVERSDNHMFKDCVALVGGAGTVYDSTHTGTDYARIDAPNAPGYFTDKNAAPVAYAIADAVTGNGKLSVTLDNPDAATLAVSYFADNGKFVFAGLQSVGANAETVALELAAGAKTARVMLLDDDFRPLCAAYPVTL